MAYPGNGDSDLDEYGAEEGQGPWGEEEQLALADDDEELPWLEADEYDEDTGFDWRLIVYAMLGLVIIGAILTMAWFLTRDSGGPDYVADGSTIEAPEGPYKQRPDDPGGLEVAGTGDQAFEIAEGEARRGRMAGDDDEPAEARPSLDLDQAEATAEAETGAVYVQIGAYSTRAEAEQGWSLQSQRYSALSGMRHRVREADVSGAKVFRLQAIAGDRDSAEATCRAIRGAGGDCYLR
ncbi:SPOR domain-containing protein [Erythrobacter alti]|uniref:SPOR domain-containing protein n=1 Tax=Erythrobacter alti TaxID=1896145 RepID=UPI0030F393FF